jgi:hypothetical protein
MSTISTDTAPQDSQAPHLRSVEIATSHAKAVSTLEGTV